MIFGENTTSKLNKIALTVLTAGLVSCAGEEQLQTLEQFQKVVPLETMSIKINSYCAKDDANQTFRFKEIFVNNLNTVVDHGRLWVDLDRDGLNPSLDNDLLFNLDLRSADTNGDGYGDLTMFRAGIDAAGQQFLAAQPCADPNQDTDNDMISDCDENLLSLDKYNPDTDGDFIPDGLELRAGLRPKDSADALVDADGDGFFNIEEIKMVTPPYETNTEQMKEHSYRYQVSSVLDVTPTANCPTYQDITVSNIPIMKSRSGNVVVIMIAEQLIESRIANDVINRIEIRKCEVFVSENESDGFVLEGEYVATPTGFEFRTTSGQVFCDDPGV